MRTDPWLWPARLPRPNDDRPGFRRRWRIGLEPRESSPAALGHLPATFAVGFNQAKSLQPLHERLVSELHGRTGGVWRIGLRVDIHCLALLLLEKGGPGLGGRKAGARGGDTVPALSRQVDI